MLGTEVMLLLSRKVVASLPLLMQEMRVRAPFVRWGCVPVVAVLPDAIPSVSVSPEMLVTKNMLGMGCHLPTVYLGISGICC